MYHLPIKDTTIITSTMPKILPPITASRTLATPDEWPNIMCDKVNYPHDYSFLTKIQCAINMYSITGIGSLNIIAVCCFIRIIKC